jgi:hypothetical protein
MLVVRVAALAACVGFVVGCTSRAKQEAAAAEFTQLQEVGDLLHAATGANGRAPAKLTDVDRFKSMFPRGYDAVKSGEIVVLWGAALQGEGDAGKDETVVAYEKDVPASGGFVLLSAGTVKKMSASEFSSAAKGATK